MRGTADGDINKGYHYLSFTRQKTKKIGYSQSRDVRITLDGDKLNQRYKGGPVDYWGASMGKQYYMSHGTESGHYDMHQSRTENEDRLFTNSPIIPNASEYIMRIDILIKPERNRQYNKWWVQDVQDILKTGFENIVFVYGDESSFDAQNSNVINEQIRSIDNGERLTDYTLTGATMIALCDLLNVIFSYECDRNQVNVLSNRKLKEYGISRYLLQKYGANSLKYIEEGLPRKSWNIDNMLANTQNMIDSLRNYDKTLYVRVMRMFNDYLGSHKIHGLRELRVYKENLASKYSNYYTSLDYSKTFNCLALADINYEEGSDYFGGAIAIPNPDTTSIWKLIPGERKYLVNDVMSKSPKHNSRSDEYFAKYLQHIVRQETSVTAFIDFINKLQVPQDTKTEILFYKKFTTLTLTAYNYDYATYLTPQDKKQVEQALTSA
jgi:hypothetical protein